MQIPRPTEADKAAFGSLVPDDARVEVKPMFGNLGAFVNGKLFMGLFGSQVGVRLSKADAATLLAMEGAGPFGPTERPMGGVAKVRALGTDPMIEAWPPTARRARQVNHMTVRPV